MRYFVEGEEEEEEDEEEEEVGTAWRRELPAALLGVKTGTNVFCHGMSQHSSCFSHTIIFPLPIFCLCSYVNIYSSADRPSAVPLLLVPLKGLGNWGKATRLSFGCLVFCHLTMQRFSWQLRQKIKNKIFALFTATYWWYFICILDYFISFFLESWIVLENWNLTSKKTTTITAPNR